MGDQPQGVKLQSSLLAWILSGSSSIKPRSTVFRAATKFDSISSLMLKRVMTMRTPSTFLSSEPSSHRVALPLSPLAICAKSGGVMHLAGPPSANGFASRSVKVLDSLLCAGPATNKSIPLACAFSQLVLVTFPQIISASSEVDEIPAFACSGCNQNSSFSSICNLPASRTCTLFTASGYSFFMRASMDSASVAKPTPPGPGEPFCMVSIKFTLVFSKFFSLKVSISLTPWTSTKMGSM
mmetsp:Transcript_120190/g.285589  ORF Transcript_120190/g.285589 Transcript_120190/m.285589 type:complete len:239 (+) Transcript_120190:198-914(+)